MRNINRFFAILGATFCFIFGLSIIKNILQAQETLNSDFILVGTIFSLAVGLLAFSFCLGAYYFAGTVLKIKKFLMMFASTYLFLWGIASILDIINNFSWLSLTLTTVVAQVGLILIPALLLAASFHLGRMCIARD